MVARRELMLQKLRDAGQSVAETRQKTKGFLRVVQHDVTRRVLSRREAAVLVQRWWRRVVVRERWRELIDDLRVHAVLERKRRESEAAYRLQGWLRRRSMRQQWLRVVNEARARRQLRPDQP